MRMPLLRLVAAGLAVSSIGFGLNPSVSFGQAGFAPRQKSSFSEKVRSGFTKMTDALTPEPTAVEAEDPISLAVKPKAEPALFVAMARQTERAGDLPGTHTLYQRAMETDPEDLDAILSYAQFNDRHGRFEEATKLYQRAAEIAPENPAVLNDLGICYARRNMLQESALAMQEAIKIEPNRPLYHNNIATVYVGMGNSERALAHLKQAHKEPVAYYNLGYLLQRRGRAHEATRYFSEALARDPSMTEAQIWLKKLQGPPLATAGVSPVPVPRPVGPQGPSLSPPSPPSLPTPLASARSPSASAPPPPAPRAAYPPMPTMSAPMPPTPSRSMPEHALETRPQVRALPPVHPVDPPTPRVQPPTPPSRPQGSSPTAGPPSSTLPVVHPLPPVR